MKRTARRSILLLFVLTALVVALATFASASEIVDSGYCGGEGDGTNLQWTLDNEGTLTITGTGKMCTGEYDYYDYSMHFPWSEYKNQIKTIIVYEGVTELSYGAFSAYNITVYLADSVAKLNSAFCNASVDFIKIGDGVTEIEYMDFWERNIGTIILGRNVTRLCIDSNIKEMYFTGNAPKSFSINKTDAIYYIPGTTGWTDSEDYDASTGKWKKYKLTIWDENSPIQFGFCGSEGDGTNLSWILNNEGTLTITGTGAMADYDCLDFGPWFWNFNESIKTVSISNNVTTIGDYAFYNCVNLTSITIPDSVTSIGEGTFAYCKGLSTVEIPSTEATIKGSAFQGCTGLTSVMIPDWVTSIGSSAFALCSELTSVTIPASVEVIDIFAFFECTNLASVYFEGNAPSVSALGAYGSTFEETVTLYYIPGTTGWMDSDAYDAKAGTWNGYKLEIWTKGYCGGEGDGANLEWMLDKNGTLTITGSGAMADYDSDSMPPWYSNRGSIQTVTISDNVSNIGRCAFQGCTNLTVVTIPDSVAAIGSNAFCECFGLTSVTIPDSVETIGDWAFFVCNRLTTVTIGDSVTRIYNGAFQGCDRLTSIYFEGDAPVLVQDAFDLDKVTFYYIVGNTGWTNSDAYNADANTWNGYKLIPLGYHNVVFDAGNGSNFKDLWIESGKVVSKPMEPTKIGYHFDGWYLGGELYDFSTPVTANITLTAQWTKLETFFGANIDLGNALDMNVYFKKSYTPNTGYVKIVREHEGVADETIEIPLTDCPINGSFYQIPYKGLAAKEMTDKLYITVYDAEGRQVSVTREESIQTYVTRMIANCMDPTEMALYVDILNYGAAAQEYFGYNTADLANALLTEEQLSYGTLEMAEIHNYQTTDGTSYFGSNLDLTSRITMNLFFKAKQSGDGAYLMVNYTDHFGKEQEVQVDAIKNGSYHQFNLSKLVVADGRCLLTCKLYKADGTLVETVTESMESYIARLSSNNSWMETVMKFSDSAYAYLHRNDY